MQASPVSETHFSKTCAFCKIIRTEELVSVSHVVQTSIIDRADDTIYIMRTMQSCLVEPYKMASTVKTATATIVRSPSV